MNEKGLNIYFIKKGYRFSCPQPGCHLPKSPRPGIIQFFPAMESLVSDIPAGDRNIDNFFYSINQKFLPKAI